jgi:hypothetical protein
VRPRGRIYLFIYFFHVRADTWVHPRGRKKKLKKFFMYPCECIRVDESCILPTGPAPARTRLLSARTRFASARMEFYRPQILVKTRPRIKLRQRDKSGRTRLSRRWNWTDGRKRRPDGPFCLKCPLWQPYQLVVDVIVIKVWRCGRWVSVSRPLGGPHKASGSFIIFWFACPPCWQFLRLA